MSVRKIVSFDWAIKNILREKANYDVLEGFVQALLHDKIKITELLESESNQDNDTMKYNRVDLLAKNSAGEDIIIEVQYAPEECYLKRLLYGTSKDIVDNISAGQSFCHVKKVYSISLIYFDFEAKGALYNDYAYHGKVNFIGVHSGKSVEINPTYLHGKNTNQTVPINDNVFPEYFVIAVNKLDNSKVVDDLDEWVYAFKNNEVKDNFKAPGIESMRQKLDFVSMSPEAQRKYDTYHISLRSNRSALELALFEANSKGLAQGVEQGLEQGIEQGKSERAIDNARNLIELGLDNKKIAKATQLSEEEVQALR